MRTHQEMEALVQDAFKLGMTQSGIETRDFALWLQGLEISNILELGTCAGGMMLLMDRVCNPGLRIVMDMPWDQRDPKCSPEHEARFKAALPDVLEIFGQIHDQEQRERLAYVLGEENIDLLFIDADHSYSGCKQHVEMYARFIRPGGFIGFHDVSNGWPCGKYVREELFPKHPHWVFEEPKNLFGIGVIQL
jgi:predicted O-methyltransferase YrrM